MSETDINATVNVTEDIYADVDSTAMSAAVIDDGDSIVVPAEVDFGHTLDTELEDNDLIDVPVDESVGIAGDHRVLLHRDAPNQHPMSAVTGLNDALADINTALSSRISQVEAETAELDVDMADALIRIGDLQNQVDGNITTWFYAAEPAMNLPPVALDPSNPHDTGWDTADKKNAHRGDLYYNTLTGYAYRFAYADGDYGWMRITDTDVVRALADAARAQDTADSKRRVFYTTPYPPYDKGDLWVQGGNGDILVCNTDKPAGGTYDFADWAKASKYTDDTVADIALASANGKNTVYHQASQPTGGTYKKGDTWFDTDNDYTMYTYDGSLWVKEQFGNEAIKDLSITNAKIANATIEYGKIKSVDAGKITVGYLNAARIQAGSIGVDKVDAESGTFNTANIPNLNANKITAGDITADRMKVNSISAINSNTGTVKISADKVNIAGAAIFTSGRLSETSLDNAYDANGAAADALADAKTYADGAVSDKAGKSDAVARQQRIYYRKTASGAPSKNTTWLTTSGTGYGNWSLKIPQMTSGTTKYPYLYTAVQTQTVSQKAAGNTCTCSDVLLDDTTTVIDGGTIITGTVNANAINASSGTFDTANIPDLNANKITAGDIAAARMKVNSIAAINSLTTGKIDAARINVGQITVGSLSDGSSYSTTSQMNTAIGNAVSGIEIGGRNLVLNTANMPAGGTGGWRASGGTATHITITDPPIAGISGGIRVTNSGTSAARIGLAQDNRYNTFVAGEKYTQSFWIRASTSFTSTVDCQPVWITSGTTGVISKSMTLTTSWQYVKGEGATLNGTQSDHYSAGYAYASNVPAGGYIEICANKVEKGTKATDWTPAPEDIASIEYIVGTQTAATNVWTGVTTDTALVAGKTIAYYLPFAGNSSAATLNLTLAGGGTTGAKNVRWNNTNITTHYPQYSVITMTYDGTYWKTAAYNSDTQNRIRWQNVIAAAEAITNGHIICGTASGYRDIAANVSFDMAYPLLYAATAIAKGATSGTRDNNFLEINGINASSNGTITSGAANKVLYLKGTISGNTFTISASPFLTTVVPTSQDNICYIPIGIMYSATNIYFKSSDQIYAYKDGAFGQISLREASAAAKTATTYITNIDSNKGITVKPSDSSGNDYLQMNSTDIRFVRNNTDVMNLTDSAFRIGTASSGHSTVKSDGLHIWTGAESTASNEVASFGSTSRIGKIAANNGNVRTSSTGMDLYVNTTKVGSLNQKTNYYSEGMGTTYSNAMFLNAAQYFAISSDSTKAFDGVKLPMFETDGHSIQLNFQTFDDGAYEGGNLSLTDGYDGGSYGGPELSLWNTTSSSRNSKETMIGAYTENAGVWLGIGSGGGNHGVFSVGADKWIIAIQSDGTIFSPQMYAKTTSGGANLRVETSGTGALKRYVSSSRRYKEDIKDIEDEALDPNKLYDVRVVQFRYKDDYLDDTDQRYGKTVNGFIAEELEEIYPIAVNYEDEMPEDWEPKFLIPPMLKLIQDQKKQIDELTERIEALERR